MPNQSENYNYNQNLGLSNKHQKVNDWKFSIAYWSTETVDQKAIEFSSHSHELRTQKSLVKIDVKTMLFFKRTIKIFRLYIFFRRI